MNGTTPTHKTDVEQRHARSSRNAVHQHDHLVQFYEDDAFLAQSVSQFLSTGLRAGDTCICVATPEHRKQIEAFLGKDADLAAARAEGHYIALDARETLGQFMIDGRPDWDLYLKTVGSTVADASKAGKQVLAFGEMVALLWDDGNPLAALELERFWNELAKTYTFSLYCAYPIRSFDKSTDAAGFAEIGERHNQVIPAESFTSLHSPIERMRAITLLQQQSRALQAEVVERQHLMTLNTAKDEFISLASHQLRTPATGVKQYVGMLLQGYMGNMTAQQRYALQKAYESNERQLKIVNDLLLVARVDAGKVELSKAPCDIVQLIYDVVREQEAEIARRAQSIELVLPRTLLAIIDPRFIRMVLENLVSNASKYSPDSSPIKITAKRRSGQVIIEVRDRGVGIRKKDHAKLYQKFSRIYNERSGSVEGTGLGLYWSKKIIELHHGGLALASKLHDGSSFTITLPVS